MRLIRDKKALTPAPDNRAVFIVSEDKQKYLILDKLLEEAFEVFTAKDREELVEELADLQEVLFKLLRLYKINYTEVEVVQARKAAEKGTFEKGFVILRKYPPSSIHAGF